MHLRKKLSSSWKGLAGLALVLVVCGLLDLPATRIHSSFADNGKLMLSKIVGVTPTEISHRVANQPPAITTTPELPAQPQSERPGSGKSGDTGNEPPDKSGVIPVGAEASVISIPGGRQSSGTLATILPAAAATVNLGNEVEPNGTSATATPLTGSNIKIKGLVFPANDVDFYSFSATAGDRVYAAVQTLYDASASGDSVLDVIAPDGTTVLESDNNDGTFNASSSSIAGTLISATGTHFLRVRHNVTTGTIRPYDLYLSVRTGSPTAETESNDTAPGQALPASGWVSGSTSSTADQDFFALSLNAGDTVFLSLDLDPERDSTEWNGRVGLGLFGEPTPTLTLVSGDAGNTGPDSEAFFLTVKDAGTYSVVVNVQAGALFGTYHLSVAVLPGTAPCTSYASADVPKTISNGAPPIP